MADIVSAATRSRMMSGIRGKNTRPEMVVRRFLHACGLRFRVHVRKLPGSPDLVFARHRAAVHVHGCFWHQHPGCRFAYMPSSNRRFWKSKLTGNAKRDKRNDAELRKLGWRVFTIWECQVGEEKRLAQLARAIRSGK